MKELGLKEEDYDFYLDLRKYGSTRHAGIRAWIRTLRDVSDRYVEYQRRDSVPENGQQL